MRVNVLMGVFLTALITSKIGIAQEMPDAEAVTAALRAAYVSNAGQGVETLNKVIVIRPSGPSFLVISFLNRVPARERGGQSHVVYDIRKKRVVFTKVEE